MSHISHYRVYLWATRPLESITKVPTGKLLKQANRLSSDFLHLLLSTFHQDSTIMVEAITTIQMRKNSITRWVLHSPLIILKERTQTSWRFSGSPTLMLAGIRHFVRLLFIASMAKKLNWAWVWIAYGDIDTQKAAADTKYMKTVTGKVRWYKRKT